MFNKYSSITIKTPYSWMHLPASIAALSPVIDAGNIYAVAASVSTDLDGNKRFVNIPIVADTGLGKGRIVDMGAYQVQHKSPNRPGRP